MSNSDYPHRYTLRWLHGIRDTERLIREAPLDEVPIEHRSLIKQQLDASVQEFRSSLKAGYETGYIQNDIADLVYLALDLVVDQDKQRMAQERNLIQNGR